MYIHQYTLSDVRLELEKNLPSGVTCSSIADPSEFQPMSWYEAKEYALGSGLPKVADRLTDAARTYLVKGNAGVKRSVERFYDLVGVTHRGRKEAGYPDCKVNFRVAKKAGKVIWMNVNLSNHSGVSAEHMQTFGEILFTFIRALERNNYSVGLRCFNYISGHNDHVALNVITLKAPGEYLDPAVTAFYVTRSEALRRIMFGLEERWPDEREKAEIGIHNGYGHPRGTDEALEKHLSGVIMPPAQELGNADEMRSRIRNLLKAQGIEVLE